MNQKVVTPQILPIPAVPQSIIRAASHGRLIVFVGAGLSKAVGCPLWSELAENLLRYLYEKVESTHSISYLEFDYLRHLPPKKLLSIVWNILADRGLPQPDLPAMFRISHSPNVFDDLYAFGAIFVTTNYDTGLDGALRRASERASITESGPTEAIAPGAGGGRLGQLIEVCKTPKELLISKVRPGNVLHLHGSIDSPESMVVTVSHYLAYHDEGAPQRAILEAIFDGKYRVLFVGYGLEELEILEFIVSRYNRAPNEARHVVLLGAFSSHATLCQFERDYYKSLGIQTVFYSMDQLGHSQLLAVIKQWANQIGPMAKQKLEFLDIKEQLDELLG